MRVPISRPQRHASLSPNAPRLNYSPCGIAGDQDCPPASIGPSSGRVIATLSPSSHLRGCVSFYSSLAGVALHWQEPDSQSGAVPNTSPVTKPCRRVDPDRGQKPLEATQPAVPADDSFGSWMGAQLGGPAGVWSVMCGHTVPLLGAGCGGDQPFSNCNWVSSRNCNGTVHCRCTGND